MRGRAAGAVATIVSAEEVAGIQWRTRPDLEADPGCPPWTLQSIQRAWQAIRRSTEEAEPTAPRG